MVRRLLKYTGIFILSLLLLALLLPLLFKDQLVERLKSAFNAGIHGKFEFADASLSLFRDFPRMNVRLFDPNCVSYVGPVTTELFKAEEIQLSINLWDLLKQKERPRIHRISLQSPDIHIVEFDSVSLNANIFKTDDTKPAEGESDLALEIESYELTRARIRYESRISGIRLSLNNMDHQGSLNTADQVTLVRTVTQVDSMDFIQNNLAYVQSAKVKLVLNLEHHAEDHLFKIQTAALDWNQLALETTGSIRLLGDSVETDIQFHTPDNAFKDLFSILPNTYTKEYPDVQSQGSFSLEGMMKGVYSGSHGLYPSWNFKCTVKDGGIQYPGMPARLEEVRVDVLSGNVGPGLSQAYLEMKDLSMKIDQQRFIGSLILRNGDQDVNVSGFLRGQLDLLAFSRFFPLEKGTKLSGVLSPDFSFAFTSSAVTSQKYEQIELNGFFTAESVGYSAPGSPDVQIPSARAEFYPGVLKLTKVNMILGKSDMQLEAVVEHPLDYVFSERVVHCEAAIRSSKLDLNEWMSPEVESGLTDGNLVSSGPPMDFSRLKLKMDAVIGDLLYEDYRIQNLNGRFLFQGDRFDILDGKGTINKNTIRVKGFVEPVMAYTYNNKILLGNLNIQADVFNADQFLAPSDMDASSSGSVAATSQAFVVPGQMDLQVGFSAGKFIYAPMVLTGVTGSLKIENQELQFKDIQSNAMGGRFGLSGVYASPVKADPTFNMKLDLSKVQFAQALASMPTMKKLAPIMEYIQGYFNSSLVFQGVLDQTMFPKLESLDLDGFIETLEGTIKGFKPLDELASKIKIPGLKSLDLKNTKNWITVRSGAVTIKDFTKNVSDIGIVAGGTHRVNSQMDYRMLVKIPKNKVDQYTRMVQLDKGVEQLSSLLSKYGLGRQFSGGLNIRVFIRGTLLHPEFDLGLANPDGSDQMDSGGVLSNVQDQIRDSLNSRIEKEVEQAKSKAEAQIKIYEDSLKKVAAKKAEEWTKSKVDTLVGGKGKDLLDSLAGKVIKDPQKEVDQIKDKLKDWNPFKKDKK
ncbi:MAG TPA: AsmA-like C-terminal region-containing protein [Saprospiraceae bacterium]|nr:AsmA-like C-terminal region-containing protein [Saprospiraceae bacterium]